MLVDVDKVIELHMMYSSYVLKIWDSLEDAISIAQKHGWKVSDENNSILEEYKNEIAGFLLDVVRQRQRNN